MSKHSVYIHVPFCASKCNYCDFMSFEGCDSFMAPYFDALQQEIALKKHYITAPLNTVFIGGGTPSYADSAYIVKTLDTLRKCCDLSADCEITIEANPNSLNAQKLDAYLSAGINRISLGAQAVQDDLLRALGRTHTFEDIMRAVESIKKAGFQNFNLDLMFALPDQTLSDWRETLRFAADSGADHISAYSLILEEYTPLFALYRAGFYEADEELDREMYRTAVDFLTSCGYGQYEISNFSKPGHICRHNLYCWHMQEYAGFGAAAHSFLKNRRFSNTGDIKEYIRTFSSDRYSLSLPQSGESLLEDALMLGLRTTAGIDIQCLNKKYSINFAEKFSEKIKKLREESLIEMSENTLRLTGKGLDFASYVIFAFLN